MAVHPRERGTESGLQGSGTPLSSEDHLGVAWRNEGMPPIQVVSITAIIASENGRPAGPSKTFPPLAWVNV